MPLGIGEAAAGQGGTSAQQRLSAVSDQEGPSEFMNLMLEQLKHQDPMDPMDQDEFMSQTAQLTSVEKLTSIAANIEEMANNQSTDEYLSLLGSTVDVYKIGQSDPASGMVESVEFTEDGAILNVGGESVDTDEIMEIAIPDQNDSYQPPEYTWEDILNQLDEEQTVELLEGYGEETVQEAFGVEDISTIPENFTTSEIADRLREMDADVETAASLV